MSDKSKPLTIKTVANKSMPHTIDVDVSYIFMSTGTWMQIRVPLPGTSLRHGIIEICIHEDESIHLYSTNDLPPPKSFCDHPDAIKKYDCDENELAELEANKPEDEVQES